MDSREAQPPDRWAALRTLLLGSATAACLLCASLWIGPADRPGGRPLPAAPAEAPLAAADAEAAALELAGLSRKEAFLQRLLPHVVAANRRILQDRAPLEVALQRLRAGYPLSHLERLHVLQVAGRFRCGEEAAERLPQEPAAVLEALLERVDVIPASLALAQAAVESAWGRSRFAREGNALFGQWVFSADAGMAPRGRAAGADYSVARFRSYRASVDAYLRNLNTHWAYADLRAARAAMRQQGAELDSLALADGLLRYSQRRELYVEELRDVIRHNRLLRFDGELDARAARVRWPAGVPETAPGSAEMASLEVSPGPGGSDG